MRLRAALACGALAATLAACSSDPAAPAASPTPTAPESTTAAPQQPELPASSRLLPLAPGRIGPVQVGMDQDDALATGLFDADLAVADAACQTPDLTWKKQFTGVDVLTDSEGTITSLGVLAADGPRTADNLGVGSTFGELIEIHGGDLSAPEPAGYGQVGVFVQDGVSWLGYLFGDATSVEQVDNDPGFTVTFAEVTRTGKPGLMRDGC